MLRNGCSIAAIAFVYSQSALATPGLPPVDESTINGIWESVDFGAGRYYRLEINWPAVSLIVTSGGSRGGEFLFRSDHGTLTRGTLRCIAEDKASGVSMRISGKIVGNRLSGLATLSLHALEGDKIRLFREWDEPERTFWKRESWSRLSELLEAEERASRLAQVPDGRQAPAPRRVPQPTK